MSSGLENGGGSAPLADNERWQLIAQLGAGSQSEVWLADDRARGDQVALKLFHANEESSSLAARFEELWLGRGLDHPHLVLLHEVVEVEDRVVLVMEWMAGGNLARLLAFEGPLPVARVQAWTRQALEALSFLHQRRVVHRDIKPANLLLDPEDRLKIADLGLVQCLDRRPGGNRTVGTTTYMAPEQLAGEPPRAQWDLYALGVTVYQLLTGHPPGDSERTGARFFTDRRTSPVRRLRKDCPRWFSNFVDSLIERQPEKRLAGAEAGLIQLDKH